MDFTLGEVHVQTLSLGPIETNTYLISIGDALMVVDPAAECERIQTALAGRVPQLIVITHGHFDHTGAAMQLRTATGASVAASAVDAALIEKDMGNTWGLPASPACPVDVRLSDGDKLSFGGVAWDVLITPGHTKGSMCLYLEPESIHAPGGLLVSGDTLFFGSCGRTDFEGGSMDEMRDSLARLSELPDQTLVLPGHGRFTEIGAEHAGAFRAFR